RLSPPISLRLPYTTLFRSGATNWTNISLSLPAVPAYALVDDPRTTGGATNGRLYVATEVGVFASTDLGTTWQRLGQGMPNVPVRSEEHTSELQSPYDLVCR